MMDQISGLGILAVAFAVVVWLLFLAIKEAARLPVRQAEWHESVLATDDAREETAPTAVMATLPPRYAREICEILARLDAEEVDVEDE